jgi:FRG domain-containing protein
MNYYFKRNAGALMDNQDVQRPYREIRLKSWLEFLGTITDTPYSHWAFRGERFAKWPLYSALARYLKTFKVDPRAWPEQEERILRIFKRKAHHYDSKPPDLDDDFQWLALMQHHGAPTRLLDFTWSPYVAAFFALEKATGDAAVWALNPARIQSRRIPAPPKFDPRIKGNFRRYYLKGNRRFIWVGEPHTMNRRLTAQSGTFALAGVLNEPMEEILRQHPDPENTMVKFILPAALVRETAMQELYRMNITYATLFPDLDGLARSLAYELEFHWAYNPHTMQPYHTP